MPEQPVSPSKRLVERPGTTVSVSAVLGGLVLLAVATGVLAHELWGLTWDWTWSAAAVLVLAGGSVLAATVVTGLRRRAGRDH